MAVELQNKRNDPSTPSGDYEWMCPYWTKVDTYQGGVDAMIAAGEKMLPRFETENDDEYALRLSLARFTNIYGDIVNGLAEKPFAEEVKLNEDGVDARLLDLAKNIDGRGSSLHVFAGQTFHAGIHRAIDWILVDYTKAQKPESGRPLSVAEEKAQGLRPYWAHIPATTMIAVYSDWIGGEEIFVHARWREDATIRDGYAEKGVKRIRKYEREPIGFYPGAEQLKATGYQPAKWELLEERTSAIGGVKEWVVVDSGDVSIGDIPIVPFFTGKRCSSSWRFEPAMRGVADLQKDHYQAENDLKFTAKMTAFPMLAGQGVKPVMKGNKPERIGIGPRKVVYAPVTGDTGQHGEWQWLEPQGTSLTFLSGEIDKIEKRMRELGRQPLTADSGNLTVVTTAFAAQKGNTAIEAWAVNLCVALERAWKLTAMWLGMKDAEPKITWNLADLNLNVAEDQGPDFLLRAREKGDISRDTLVAEFQRRNILSPDYDAEKDKELLDAEAEEKITYEGDLFDATTPDLPDPNAPQSGQPLAARPAAKPAPKPAAKPVKKAA